MTLFLETAFVPPDWRWLTTAFLLIACYRLAHFYYKVSKYPKGPFPLPRLGNMLTHIREKRLYQKAIACATQFGDPVTLWFGSEPMVILHSDAVVREALIRRMRHFSDRIPPKMDSSRLKDNHNILFEDYNPTQKTLRRVTMSAVRKYAVSEALENLCRDVVDDYVDTLKESRQLLDSREPPSKIIFSILGIAVYGKKAKESKSDLNFVQTAQQKLLEAAPRGIVYDIVPWLRYLNREQKRKVNEILRNFRRILNAFYRQAKADYVPGTIENFTHAMMAAKEELLQESKGDAQYLTEGNIIQVLTDIFVAGTESTLGELQWMLLIMAKEPNMQYKIQKEIKDNIGDAPPTMNDRDKLPYTVAFILETLRFYPIVPVGLPHKTASDTEAGGRKIPKGTGVLYNIYGLNHDATLWKDPDVFRPERFLDPAEKRLSQDHLPQVVTFGLGARACAGEKMGHAILFYSFVRLMQRLSISPDMNVSDVNMTVAHSHLFLNPPDQGIVCTKRHYSGQLNSGK